MDIPVLSPPEPGTGEEEAGHCPACSAGLLERCVDVDQYRSYDRSCAFVDFEVYADSLGMAVGPMMDPSTRDWDKMAKGFVRPKQGLDGII